MCFSATASFSVAALLLGVGTLTLKSARRPRELPFAAIPLLFAIQQLSEGVIWLTFRYDAPPLGAVVTRLYSFFSHVLWPIYVPVAVWLIEPAGRRRRVTPLEMSKVRNVGVGMSSLSLAVAVAAGSASAAAGKVYVADEEADSVSVIDTASFKKIRGIPVGQGPHNVQVAPDGKLVWVTNNGEPGKSVDKPAHQGMPKSAGGGSMAGGGAVWAIDTATDSVVAKVAVGKHPAHVVVAPDGRHAYVVNGGDNTVSVVDIPAQRVVDTIAVGAAPHGMRFSPDGKQAWVANLKGGTVSVIDTKTRKQIAQIAVGEGPAQVGFTPDGRLGFVSLSEENRVAMIDPAARKVLRKVSVGSVPIQVYATPDSRLLLVANQGTRAKPGSTVSMIDLGTFKTVATIKTGAGAHGVVVNRDGRRAYVTNTYANTVSVIDVGGRKVIATVPVGRGPNGVSLTP